MQSAQMQTPARQIQGLPSPSMRQLYWTPEMQAVTRDSKVGKRALTHRFYKKFDVRTCGVTNKSSTAVPALMVELAHMKPHSDTGDTDDMNRWAWMMGYAYRGTFHIDTRLNLMPLNIYVHRLLDAHLVTFVLDKSIIKMVEEKLRANSSVKTAAEERQRILTDLDKEMPDGGWPVTLLATNICDKAEAIMVHDLVQGLNGRFRTAETYQVFKYPFAIPFNTATSPIFILANMQKQRKQVRIRDIHWYHANWKSEHWDHFNEGAQLLDKFIHMANVPECFKRRVARDTRESSRGKTMLGLPQVKYDYIVGKYDSAEKSAAKVTQSNSDGPENENHSDTEEESESDGQEPLEKLLDLASISTLDPFRIKHMVHFKSSIPSAIQPPESVSDDADNKIDEREIVESSNSFSEEWSRSEYINDGTGSETESRDSPLRLRSRAHAKSNVNLLDRSKLL